MAIASINGVAQASIASLNGVAAGTIATVSGIEWSGGGGPAWYQSLDGASATGTQSNGDSSFLYVQPITLPAGTVSKLSIYLDNPDGATALKLKLYDSGGGLAIGGTFSSLAAGWNDIDVTPTAITGGSCHMAFMAFSNTLTYAVNTGQPSGTSYQNFDIGYFTWVSPADATLPANDANLTALFAVRAYITP